MNRLRKIRENIQKLAGLLNLYREKEGALLGGVCKMIAEKFMLKVSYIRILFLIASTLSLGIGVIFYGILVWLLPRKEKEEKDYIDVTYKEKRENNKQIH